MPTRSNPRKEKWDRRFLSLAKFVAQWSKDPSTKVGAVIVDEDNRVVSMGYNGFPKGVRDTRRRLNNRDLKYKFTVHGELNSLIFAKGSVAGCRLYVWPFMTCSLCAGPAIQAGIIEIIAPVSDNPRWKEDFKISKIKLREARVKLALTTYRV